MADFTVRSRCRNISTSVDMLHVTGQGMRRLVTLAAPAPAHFGAEPNARSEDYGSREELQMTVIGILGIWIALNATVVLALLTRDDRSPSAERTEEVRSWPR